MDYTKQLQEYVLTLAMKYGRGKLTEEKYVRLLNKLVEWEIYHSLRKGMQ